MIKYLKLSKVILMHDLLIEQLVIEVAAGGVSKEEISYFFENGVRRLQGIPFSLLSIPEKNIIS